MATTKEMSLARQVLQLGMMITAQGKMMMHVDYSAHIDSISVWDDNGSPGWRCNDHCIYLGDFHNDCFDQPTKKAEEQLSRLIAEMELLVGRDADGVPV